MAGLARALWAAMAPPLSRFTTAVGGLSTGVAAVYSGARTRLPPVHPAANFGVHASIRWHNVQEGISHMGATVLTTFIPGKKRSFHAVEEAADAPRAKRLKRSPHALRNVALITASRKRKRELGDDDESQAYSYKKPSLYIQGLTHGWALGMTPSTTMLQQDRTPQSLQVRLKIASVSDAPSKDGLEATPWADEEQDEWAIRSASKAQAKESARRAAQEASRIIAEAKAENEKRQRERRKQKKKAAVVRARKADRIENSKDFQKAEAEYKAEVERVLAQIAQLGFAPGSLGADDTKSTELLAEAKPAKKAPITEISADWLTKVRKVLDIRTEHSVVGKSVEGVEISRKDIGRILPGEPWLNDEVVNAWYANLCARLNEKDGYVKGPNNVPRWVAYSSAWFNNVREKGASSIQGWSRRKGIKNDKLLQTERIFFPTNTGVHWTLLTISGKNKTIEYLDSLNTAGYNSSKHTNMARAWLRMELGAKYKEEEWVVVKTISGQQGNCNDCGVFSCFNGWALGRGATDPSAEFGSDEMPWARQMLAAVLLNGGFTGEFDL